MIPDHVTKQENACRATIASLKAEITGLREKQSRATKEAATSRYDPIGEKLIAQHYQRQIDRIQDYVKFLESKIPPHTIWREDVGCYERIAAS